VGVLNTLSPSVVSGGPIIPGEVVQVIPVAAGSTIKAAQANIAANIQGTIGVTLGQSPVATGGPMVVATAGPAFVLLETVPLLVLANGETLFVSATQPGRATNVAPVNARSIGVIHDKTMYALKGGVVCDLQIGTGGSASAGSFDMLFSGTFSFGVD